MSKRMMSISICVLVFTWTAACGAKKSDDSEAAPSAEARPEEEQSDRETRLRGYAELSKMMETSLMVPTEKFSLSSYVGGGFVESQAYGLAPLMGYFKGDPVHPEWVNTTPNTVTTAVYLLAFSDLARDLLQVCDQSAVVENPVAQPNESFKKLLVNYCNHGTKMDDIELLTLWSKVTLGLAPKSDFAKWRDDLALVDDLPAAERLEYLMSTSLSSPWVLFHF